MCENGSVMSKYSIMLEDLLRLRQLCCHISLVSKAQLATDHSAPLQMTEIIQRIVEMLQTDTLEDDCGICLEPIRASTVAVQSLREQPLFAPFHHLPSRCRCAHVFCAECAEGSLRVNPLCPLCCKPVQVSELIDPPSLIEPPADPNITQSSSNVNALIQSLLERREKSLVFPQFTSFPELISIQLTSNGIQYVRLDGTKSVSQCRAAVHSFQQEQEVMVFPLQAQCI